jgi:signal transduction histidine kinase
MKRPWQVWLAFALCSTVLGAAMAWLTVHALRVDRERSAARAESELEQRIGLALWRMDTKLAPLIAEEIARPHLFYDSFISVNSDASGKLGQFPSPLLNASTRSVILNFDATSAGEWKSPQAPPPQQAELAEANGLSMDEIASNRQRLSQLAQQVDVAKLIERLPSQPLPQQQQQSAAEQRQQIGQSVEYGLRTADQGSAPTEEPNASPQAFLDNPLGEEDPRKIGEEQRQVKAPTASADKPPGKAQQGAAPYADFGSRKSRYEQAAQQEFTKQRGANSLWNAGVELKSTVIVESVSRPLWVGDQLLLARRVDRAGEAGVQGSWLDWPRIKADLLTEASALSLDADLIPVRSEAEARPTRMLAGLPVQLVVNNGDAALAELAELDAPLQWALGFGWVALGLALAAVAALLWGVLALSERRAAFVSSVTHELRTPLTTFRMYSEMLARDMAPPASRGEYLETLRKEAERLTHLVENVLSYARLERGRRPTRSECTTAAALVDRFQPRLAERAAQAQMTLEVRVDAAAAETPLTTDVGVVEQILFNLVDNAAKYAACAIDRRICLDVLRDGKVLKFRVSDFGPGFVSLSAARRGAPFSKSAQEAAETAPGVGLGLALCRRLARELDGRLEIASNNGDRGSTIVLRLSTDSKTGRGVL